LIISEFHEIRKYSQAMVRDKRITLTINRHNQPAAKVPAGNKQKLLKGEFKLDENNNLIYFINKPASWCRKYNIPNKIEFRGKWRLTSNHDLALDIEEKEERWQKKSLVLKGEVLDCKENCLIFKVKSRLSPALTRFSLLKLKGRWRADKFNRITFEVSKKEKPDILTFKGAWSLNGNQQIIYKYEKLKTKFKRGLIFRGFWDISLRNRLSYILEGSEAGSRASSLSGFDFRAYLGSPNVYPAKGKIKYRIGIGLKKERVKRTVTLYGIWKFSRKLGLIFEMDYAGRIRRIQFAATVDLSRKDRITFTLRDKENKPLGMSLTFRRRFLPRKDFEYFLRLKRNGQVSGLDIGGTLRF